MKPICFIPARGGSKNIKRKNIRLLGNKPLIAYSIESALASKLFSHIVISTEDEEIARIAMEYGAEVPFVRPKKYALDNTSNDEVLYRGLLELQKLGFTFEVVMLRDCTVPFIDENDMEGALNLLEKSDCDAVFGAIKAHPNPYFGMMEMDSNDFLVQSKVSNQLITRRQDAPIVYDIDGMFVVKSQQFLKSKKIISGKIMPYEISKEHGHMIDFEFDFKVAELLIKENPNI